MMFLRVMFGAYFAHFSMIFSANSCLERLVVLGADDRD